MKTTGKRITKGKRATSKKKKTILQKLNEDNNGKISIVFVNLNNTIS